MFDVHVEHFADGRRAAAEALRFVVRSVIAGREPRLYPLGHRFGDGSGRGVPELAEIRRRFLADGREAPGGTFSLVRFRMEKPLARVAERVDPAALEKRLAEAAGKALHDRLGWAEGVVHVTPGDGREVVALLSARRADGGPARLLGPVDVQGLQAAWQARSYDVMAMRHDLPGISPPLQIRVWKQAADVLQRALGGRVNGEASRQDALTASRRVEEARGEWRRAFPALTGAAPGRMHTVRFTLDNGAANLTSLAPPERRDVLQLAVERVARDVGLGAVSVVDRPRMNGRDLDVLVQYSEGPGARDRGAFAEALAARLGPAIEEEAGRHHCWNGEARQSRVILNRSTPATVARDGKPGSERQVSFSEGLAVRFRLERGAAYLAAFPDEQQRQVLERAARRAFPGLWQDGTNVQLGVHRDGNALMARLVMPNPPGGPVPDLRPPPEAQARFVNEVYRAGAELQGRVRKEGLSLAPARLAATGRPSPGKAVRGPLMALPQLSLGRLGLAVPAAFRIARGVSRVVGALLPAREE